MPRSALAPQEEVPSPQTQDTQLDVDEKPLTAVRVRLAPTPGELPSDLAREHFKSMVPILDGSLASRRAVNTLFAWEAPALCHGPIYIQDVNLERYGYSHGALQPAYSAVHFLGSVAILPYLVGTYPQRECIYNLGYYRPGSYAPYQVSLPRLSLRGVALEGGVVTGMAFGIPGFIP